MTQKTLFVRKIVYVVIIAILLFPIYIFGNPSHKQKDNTFSSGGILASMYQKDKLSEAEMGEIDPAGSAMKLATFGMRGVAISLLWNRSLEYEKRADWDNVVATAEQIITLEPHFITIWDFVGWKLAYNASAMFDDYRERYRWVIRGFEFVQRGTEYNREAPKLYVRTGWTISQKIGIADEKKQYRRLFREDEELAARQKEREIFTDVLDNWLLGHAFYKQAEYLYENHNGDIGKETRLLFFGRAPLNRIRYAEWMSIDGCGVNKTNTPVFDVEHCANAWKHAEEDWELYSNKVVVTTIEDSEHPGEYRSTSLNYQREYAQKMKECEDRLISMLPEGVTRETIIWDRWNNELDDKQRASLYEMIRMPFDENDYNLGEVGFPYRVVRSYLDGEHGEQPGWDKDWLSKLYDIRISCVDEDLRDLAKRPDILLSSDQEKDHSSAFQRLNDWQLRSSALLKITPEVLAANVVPEKQAEANDIVAEIEKYSKEESFSRMFRDIMGADYHSREVVFEQEENARKAHEHRQAVRDKYNAAQPEEANKEFLACFDSWVALIKQDGFTDLRYMPQFHSDLMDELEKYVIVLEQLETVFPKEFSFQEIIREDQRVKHRLDQDDLAKKYIQQEMADGKYEDAVADSVLLTSSWAAFNGEGEIYALAPIPETAEGYFSALKNWVVGWEHMPEEQFKLAKETGQFNDYPGKGFLEFILQKSDENYLEIERLDVERVNDASKNFENLEKQVALWAKVVDKFPVLKYDDQSEFYQRIQTAVLDYKTELTKQNKALPEDFPLKSFEETSRRLIDNN
ncbi:MAG: hypothetical protein IKX88_11555 [Thermoguttaceae bacterium]|nr:hypothetical protein [Thermoguttaceae bacterium]